MLYHVVVTSYDTTSRCGGVKLVVLMNISSTRKTEFVCGRRPMLCHVALREPTGGNPVT
jgi:hypothetical protein